MIQGQAITLRYIDVGTYSTLVSPLALVFSFFMDLTSGKTSKPIHVVIGILLATFGAVADGYLSTRAPVDAKKHADNRKQLKPHTAKGG